VSHLVDFLPVMQVIFVQTKTSYSAKLITFTQCTSSHLLLHCDLIITISRTLFNRYCCSVFKVH